MRKTVRFSEEELKKIETAIADAEMRTSGEIVPMIVNSSHDYAWVHWLWAAIGWVTTTLILWALHVYFTTWPLPLHSVFLWQVVGALFGATLSYFPASKRFSIPERLKAFHVHRQCLANFTAAGLHETRDRTGILIYVSLLERRVEILADRGIHQKLGEDYWKAQVEHIITGIHQGQATTALCQAINEMGQKLAENFPRQTDDINELANHLRRGHQSMDQGDGRDRT